MSTTVYSGWKSLDTVARNASYSSGKCRLYVTYWTENVSAAAYKVTFRTGIEVQGSSGVYTLLSFADTITMSASGKSNATTSRSSVSASGGSKKNDFATDGATHYWQWDKSTSASTKTIKCQLMSGFSVSATITVPALESHTISFNGNSGTGVPSSQTKYYGKTLTLSSTKPTKSGYTFKGWAKTTARAGSGTVDFSETYSENPTSDVTLYAVWELVHVAPIITGVGVTRLNADGTENPEGVAVEITFDWSVFRSSLAQYYGGSSYPYSANKPSSSYVQISGGDLSSPITKTLTLADAGSDTDVSSGVITKTNGFSTDKAYDVVISITDTPQTASGVTAITSTYNDNLPTAFFPLDFNENASALGIFRPAPDNEDGVFLGKDLYLANGGKVISLITDSFNSGQVSWSAGTVGTRGAQVSKNVEKAGYTPIGVCITYVSASTSFNPSVFFSSDRKTLYFNFYRASASAVSNTGGITALVLYSKN